MALEDIIEYVEEAFEKDAGLMKLLGRDITEAAERRREIKKAKHKARLRRIKKKASFEKRAAKKEKKFKVKSLGFMDSQHAMGKVLRSSDKGLGQFLAKNEVIGGRIKHLLGGGAIGAAGGGGLGALAGRLASKRKGSAAAGALIGALLGGLAGSDVAVYRHDAAYLRKHGINPRWLGLYVDVTPGTKKKYV